MERVEEDKIKSDPTKANSISGLFPLHLPSALKQHQAPIVPHSTGDPMQQSGPTMPATLSLSKLRQLHPKECL